MYTHTRKDLPLRVTICYIPAYSFPPRPPPGATIEVCQAHTKFVSEHSLALLSGGASRFYRPPMCEVTKYVAVPLVGIVDEFFRASPSTVLFPLLRSNFFRVFRPSSQHQNKRTRRLLSWRCFIPRAKVSVTYDDEPGPEGFERVSRDLAKGGTSGRKAFLWLKRHAQQRPNTNTNTADAALGPRGRGSDDSEGSDDETAKEGEDGVLPIGEAVVAFGSADPNAEEAAEIDEQERVAAAADSGAREMGGGVVERRAVRVWEKLDRSLNPSAVAGGDGGEGEQQRDGVAVFLWFRRVSEEEPLSWSAHSLTVREGWRRPEDKGGGREDVGTGQWDTRESGTCLYTYG